MSALKPSMVLMNIENGTISHPIDNVTEINAFQQPLEKTKQALDSFTDHSKTVEKMLLGGPDTH